MQTKIDQYIKKEQWRVVPHLMMLHREKES